MKLLNKYWFIIIILTVFLSLFINSCSKNTSPTVSLSHPDGWVNSNSTDFHGTKSQVTDKGFCMDCHGQSFEGGTSEVSCYTCHNTYPHANTWSDMSSLHSHGKLYNDSIETCKNCHGEDFKGGTTKVSCYTCHPSDAF